VLAGVGTMAVLATSDRAWTAWDGATDGRLPRRAVRTLLVATGVVHVLEAVATHRRATALGLEDRGRWVRSTLVYGFPALVQLGRAADPAGAGRTATTSADGRIGGR
jgi:hypothetical protein